MAEATGDSADVDSVSDELGRVEVAQRVEAEMVEAERGAGVARSSR